MLAGTGSSTFSALALGTDGFVLTVDSSCASGLKWAAGGGSSGGITSLQFNSPLTSSPNPVTAGVAAVDITYASTSTCGAVQLADTAATQAGVSATLAITAAGAAATYFPTCDYTALGQIAVGTGANTFNILPVGANGTGLVACSACPSGLYWGSALVPAQPTVLGAVFGLGEPGLNQNFSVGCGTLGLLTTGQGNTAVGLGGLAQVTSGCFNTALGTQALFAEQTGVSNTALGTGALCAQNGVSNNTAIGYGAGNSITTGFNNTALGSCAADSLTTGCNNVFIGSSAGALNTTGSKVVIIGADGTSSTTTVSNEANIYAGTTVARFAQGGVAWTFTSDARKKENVADLTLGLDFINKIQSRTFDWKEDGQHSAGFIAQELDAVVEEFNADYLGVVSKADLNSYSVAQAALIPVLVNAIKELAAEVAELKAKLN